MTGLYRSAPLVALLLAASACSQDPAETPDETAQPTVATDAPDASGSPRSDASAPAAGPLVPDTISLAEWREVDLTGELGCSFNRNAREDPLLFAAADVADDARAEAAVKVGGSVEKLSMDRAGGFNALSEGGRFSGGDDLVATVAITGENPIEETPRIAMESPRYSAMLTFTRAGQSVALDGFWECGP